MPVPLPLPNRIPTDFYTGRTHRVTVEDDYSTTLDDQQIEWALLGLSVLNRAPKKLNSPGMWRFSPPVSFYTFLLLKDLQKGSSRGSAQYVALKRVSSH